MARARAIDIDALQHQIKEAEREATFKNRSELYNHIYNTQWGRDNRATASVIYTRVKEHNLTVKTPMGRIVSAKEEAPEPEAVEPEDEAEEAEPATEVRRVVVKRAAAPAESNDEVPEGLDVLLKELRGRGVEIKTILSVFPSITKPDDENKNITDAIHAVYKYFGCYPLKKDEKGRLIRPHFS